MSFLSNQVLPNLTNSSYYINKHGDLNFAMAVPKLILDFFHGETCRSFRRAV